MGVVGRVVLGESETQFRDLGGRYDTTSSLVPLLGVLSTFLFRAKDGAYTCCLG